MKLKGISDFTIELVLDQFWYVDYDDSFPDDHLRVGDYGYLRQDLPTGSEAEIPFEIVLDEEYTGLPMFVLKTGRDGKPEDRVDDGSYCSILQAQLDGFEFYRTGSRHGEPWQDDSFPGSENWSTEGAK